MNVTSIAAAGKSVTPHYPARRRRNEIEGRHELAEDEVLSNDSVGVLQGQGPLPQTAR